MGSPPPAAPGNTHTYFGFPISREERRREGV